MKQGSRLRIIFILICVLLISQIIWWIIFNIQQNDIILEQRKQDVYHRELMLNYLPDSLIMSSDISRIGIQHVDGVYHVDSSYISFLSSETRRKNIMFISESLFVMILVIWGIFIVYRSFRHELKMAMQQQNFLLSITHELKTPISSVKLLLQTLTRKNIPDLKRESFINESLTELERLNDLVTNIIQTTKAETNEKPRNISSINLSDFLETSFKQHRKQGEVELHITMEPHYEIKMNIDDAYLIFSNIIRNAIEYSNKTPVIIGISAEEDDNYQYISVRDNGIGIPDKEQEHIFNRFYRIGNEATRNYNGTGIGLYIVKLILSKYDADIHVSESSDSGSVFTIELKKG